MTPDYQKAAIKAMETLIQYQIGTAPIDPLPILKNARRKHQDADCSLF